MHNSQELANHIKQIAKSKKISIGKMLSDCELSVNTLSSMQSGGYYPRIEAISKIAEYLNCSVDYLLGRTSVPISHKLMSGENMMKFASRLREAMAARVIEIKEKASKEEADDKYGAMYWEQESKKFGLEITSDRITKLLDAKVSPTYDEVHIFHKMLDVPEEWLIGIDPKAPEKIIQLRLSRLGKIEDGKITLLGVADASPKTRETFDGMDEETFNAKLDNATADQTDVK